MKPVFFAAVFLQLWAPMLQATMAEDHRNLLPFRTVAWLIARGCLTGFALGFSAGLDYAPEGKRQAEASTSR